MLMSPIRNKIEIQNNKHKKKNKEWNLSILKIFHYRHQNFTSKTAIKDKVFKNATQNQTLCVCVCVWERERERERERGEKMDCLDGIYDDGE